MDYVLETKSLLKSYRHIEALSGVDMHVPKDSIYGLVGRNGAGKTTLMRIVAGMQKENGGTYSLFGVDKNRREIKKERKRVGAMIESPAIFHDLSAEENLKMQYRILGLPSFESISEILATVGLENTGKKKAGSFSFGMKQRLGIAMAIAGNPDLLILDEPINGDEDVIEPFEKWNSSRIKRLQEMLPARKGQWIDAFLARILNSEAEGQIDCLSYHDLAQILRNDGDKNPYRTIARIIKSAEQIGCDAMLDGSRAERLDEILTSVSVTTVRQLESA